MTIGRREFIRSGLVGAGAGLVLRSPKLAFAAANSTDSRIEILLSEPLGAISPNVYGHFIEHLGGVVYDGVWVGKNSKVPNVDGIRKELIDQMRRIKAPVVRYPGGCFADSYDWRDGVGPSEKRPRRTNFWSGAESANSPANHNYEPNEFGTDEFVRFCKACGSQPYLAANVRSLPPEQFYRWVEYCNSPAGSTTLADQRAANGSKDPYHVRFWGVGNESWGCGGNFTPEEYAVEFRRFVTWVPGYSEQLSFIASGPNSDEWDWTRGFLEELVKKGKGQLNSVYGLALHYYAWNMSRGRTNDWDKGKGDALNFDTADWYEILSEGDRMEGMINRHWQIMAEIDTEHKIKLIVDEWGPWYKPGSELTAGHLLEQTPTIRDAVFSGMTLDTFNRHPEKVALAATAQLVNCLNSPFLAAGDKFVVSPVGHVFAMYAAHQGGQAIRSIFSAPTISYDRDGKRAMFWGLNGSASLQGKELVITVVNPSTSDARETEIVTRGGVAKSARVTTLSAKDIHAHNTFTEPDAVVPRTAEVKATGPSLNITFGPASVTLLQVSLA
jgi:alpha-L-arabinofuranosidase